MSARTVTGFAPAYLSWADGFEAMSVQLRWRIDDPWAVELRFLRGLSPAVVWMVARELLTEGLHTCAGFGDVAVRPDEHDAETTVLVLDSPDGHAEFEIDTDALRAFLDATYARVPAGTEPEFVDMDALVAWLLEGEDR